MPTLITYRGACLLTILVFISATKHEYCLGTCLFMGSFLVEGVLHDKGSRVTPVHGAKQEVNFTTDGEAVARHMASSNMLQDAVRP